MNCENIKIMKKAVVAYFKERLGRVVDTPASYSGGSGATLGDGDTE